MATGFTVGTTDLDSIFKPLRPYTGARSNLGYYSAGLLPGDQTVSSRYQPTSGTKDQIGWHTGFGYGTTDFRYIFQAINYYIIEADLSSTPETVNNYNNANNGVINYTVYTTYLKHDANTNFVFTVTLENVTTHTYTVAGNTPSVGGSFTGRDAGEFAVTVRCSVSGAAISRNIWVTYGGGDQSVSIR